LTAPPAEGRRGRNPLRGFLPTAPVRLWRLNPQKFYLLGAGDNFFLLKKNYFCGLNFGAVPTSINHFADKKFLL